MTNNPVQLLTYAVSAALLMVAFDRFDGATLGFAGVGAVFLGLVTFGPWTRVPRILTWAMTMAFLAALGHPAQWTLEGSLLAALGVGGLFVSLQALPAGAPKASWGGFLVAAGATFALTYVAWWPRISLDGEQAVVIDPASSAGMAVRSLALVAFTALGLGLIWVVRSLADARGHSDHDAILEPRMEARNS